MNRIEHLLTCLGEECAETAQRVSKALRFGLHEVQPGVGHNNLERIAIEARDVLCVLAILDEELGLDYRPDAADIAAKLAKIERNMAISREQGVLV